MNLLLFIIFFVNTYDTKQNIFCYLLDNDVVSPNGRRSRITP